MSGTEAFARALGLLPMDEDRARAAVLDRMSHGRTLSKELLGIVAEERGSFFTSLHPSVPDDRHYLLTGGGNGPYPFPYTWPIEDETRLLRPRPDWDRAARAAICALIAVHPGGVVLFEDQIERASRGGWAGPEDAGIVHEDDVLYFLDADSADPVHVQRRLNGQRHAIWLSVTAVLAGHGEPVSLKHKQVLSSDDLNRLVRTVRCVAVGAYDAEGHVIWLRETEPGG